MFKVSVDSCVNSRVTSYGINDFQVHNLGAWK